MTVDLNRIEKIGSPGPEARLGSAERAAGYVRGVGGFLARELVPFVKDEAGISAGDLVSCGVLGSAFLYFGIRTIMGLLK